MRKNEDVIIKRTHTAGKYFMNIIINFNSELIRSFKPFSPADKAYDLKRKKKP